MAPVKMSGHRNVYLAGTAVVTESKKKNKVESSTPMAVPLDVAKSALVVSIYSTKP